jgi:hypothetical protein
MAWGIPSIGLLQGDDRQILQNIFSSLEVEILKLQHKVSELESKHNTSAGTKGY